VSDADRDERLHPFLRLLHLLWAVPVAAMMSLGLLFAAAISGCGISGCGGGGYGVATGYREFVPVFTWGIGAVWFLFLAFAPWLRPWWLRCAIALVIGLAMGAFFTSAITPQAS